MLCFDAISSLIAFFFDPQSFHCQNVAPCLQAPPGCSQYHTEPQGTILSLNYLDKQYPLGTRLDVCIKKAPGACGVQYDLGKMGVGTTKTGGIGYGLVGSCLVPNFPISSTFIFARFVMTTLCSGERRPPCVAGGDGRTVTLPARGPLGFTFSSDGRALDRVGNTNVTH